MATKRITDIDINIRVRSGVIHADASVTWTVPDVPEVPPQTIPVALVASAGQTIAEIVTACDLAGGVGAPFWAVVSGSSINIRWLTSLDGPGRVVASAEWQGTQFS